MLRSRTLLRTWLGVVLATSWAGGSRAQAPRRNHSPAKASPATTAPAGGEKIYNERCAACHFSASTAKKIGPGLKGLYKRGRYADGRKVDDESLRAWIEKGSKNMPGFAENLKAEEIRALIAYLKTL